MRWFASNREGSAWTATILSLVAAAGLVAGLVQAAPTADETTQYEQAGWLNLTVIHTNDVHARVDPANLLGVACSAEDVASGHCYGGSARHKTVIEGLRKANKNSLLLDGGDEFQGTLFYTYFRGNVTADVMNELGYDLGTIGNHEWDDGPANLGRYWPKLKFPIVCANVDLSKNPTLAKWVKPYHIFPQLELAVIGYITNTTGDISNAGPTVSFTDPIPAVQKYVDELEKLGIKRILALSHNGYGPDMELARKTRGVDLIVGGHSHSYLGDKSNPLSEGPYPTVIKNLAGENTLIVQAFCWGRYIGHLDVVFNPDGKIVEWAGQPILVENTLPADKKLLKEITGWRNEFNEWGQTVLGVADGDLDQASCKQGECTMGNFVADAMLWDARGTHTSQKGVQVDGPLAWTDFAFINSGGIRSGLPAGNITIEKIMTTSPFGNVLVQTELRGYEILAMLEDLIVGKHKTSQRLVTSNIQISGLRYVYDSSKVSSGSSPLISAEIMDHELNWRPVLRKQVYRAVTLDFVLHGGDNILENNAADPPRVEIKLEVLDKVLMDYVSMKKIVKPYKDGRIHNVAPGKGIQHDEEIVQKRGSVDWPASTPEYLKSLYPDGMDSMLQEYARFRENSEEEKQEKGHKTGKPVFWDVIEREGQETMEFF